MIELRNDQLRFSFPEVHPQAQLTIEFQRTLRIPDDEKSYSLPPGLGRFPLRHVDDHAANIPARWLQRGGVMLPMYQSEAMWLRFDAQFISERNTAYPFAIKVAAGKQCAVTGDAWSEGLSQTTQNYMVAPNQPWLDGFVIERGLIRQFVAMPLGSGYSAEEQITGQAEHGGLQIAVCPMKPDVFNRRFPERVTRMRATRAFSESECSLSACDLDMALAPGGQMRQEIYQDPFGYDDWQQPDSSRCFVHLCNSLVWNAITGSNPPHPAPTAKQYTHAGLPWFDYYDDSAAPVDGSSVLSKLKSVFTLGNEKGDVPLPENESVTPDNLVVYRKGLRKEQVREGAF